MKLMYLHLRVALACISGLLVIPFTCCDNPLDQPDTVKWSCVCSVGPPSTTNKTPASNCSSSCDCIPGGPDNIMWNCSCATLGPQVPGNVHDTTCFTACNCTSDRTETPVATKKHLSNKGLLVILLLCFLLATIALFTLAAYCFYYKERLLMQASQISSEKDLSWNSTTNLISHRFASFQPHQSKTSFLMKPISGIIQKLTFIYSSGSGTLPGIIAQFPYVELEDATDRFSTNNLIGVGGSSNVYRGQLKDGKIVAIKKLRPLGRPEVDSEFLYEIDLISRLNHCHVVPLLGYCIETQGRQLERLLVFEYMSNGNLRECLDERQGKEPLDWETRIRIAIGAARGLEYLHEAAAPKILHRDIKSTNILLDDNFRAKITDLGMAKQIVADDITSCSSSPARMLGTFGYFAPEYAIIGKATPKSDVFSFGVVVLELITGRKPIFKSSSRGEDSLVIWAASRLCDSKLVVSELPDSLLNGKFPAEEMQIMAHLARECLQWDPDSRPTMSEVVQILLTIAPDKSRKRIIPTSLFWSPYSRSTRGTSGTQTPDVPAERQDQSRAINSQARHSLSLPIDRNFCVDRQKKLETVISGEHMERLILLELARRSSDDETVDLTEPRFESFMEVNTSSLS
ncbi:receptor-like serine/threonine-protein kinase NCRK isoform X2 [Canna indica]|uniref:non-specific serine/threonine protein kinase n=1 Tax=Canna indica TaxID=4628 RepID=A0AAQ3JUS3_9LILI|nr:receptor-like serine/threonine-protein kinase NCRK isoform X2 [Canna indica]